MGDKELIKEKLSYFPKLYDLIQIFGPMSEEKLLEKKGACLLNEDCIKKNACNNCVVISSLMDNKTISKYEEYEGKAYTMTATPVIEGGHKYIVELLRELNEDDLKFMGAAQQDVIKQIEILNNKLMNDPLTGVFNRRFMEEKLPFIVLDSVRNNRQYSIIMADIDLFKKVNDKYGHQAGDIVLERFAALLKNTFSEEESLVIRFGGEEFLIYIGNEYADTVKNLVEKVRQSFEDTTIEFEGYKIKTTASFGVVTVKKMLENKESCLKRIINMADANLYEAKNTGRNGIVATIFEEQEK